MHGLDDLLTVAQAAEVLNVKPGTLNGWRWSGLGPAYVKVGGGVRYLRGALREYIAAQTHIPVISAMRAGAIPESREERLARLRSQRTLIDRIGREFDLATAQRPKRTAVKIIQRQQK